MFGDQIVSALSSLAPFWSNEIVKSFALGNEYTMAINMILSGLIKFLSTYLTDFMSVLLVLIVTVVIGLKALGINIININSIIKVCNNVSVIATEKVSNGEISMTYSKAFKAVNLLLINNYGVKKLRYLKDANFDIIVDDVLNLKLENDLYVTIKRDPKDYTKIIITLSSYNKNLHELIQSAINLYDDDDKTYKLKFVGTEQKGSNYSYPDPMKYLTYVLVHTYKMNKLKVLHEVPMGTSDPYKQEREESKEKLKNATKTAEEARTESLDELNKKFKNIFLLENCKNHKLEEDIFITIERSDDFVKYTLLSNTIDLKDFLKKCIETCKTDISVRDYKYRVKLTGYESTRREKTAVQYPKNLIALCNKLINDGHVSNFKIVESESDKKSLRLIDNITNLFVDNILINTVCTVQSPTHWESYICTSYILESNTVDLVEYLEKCESDYDDYLNNKNTGTIYYFKYLGKFGNELKFSKSVLSSKENKLHETFDNIYNEHTEGLKNDLVQLKDIQYYKKTGLRRKKSYMFYGEPGCGKNASVVAMALEDNRHIIDIPFSILQYNSEFYEIMNLTSISGISFKRDQIIVVFDEMHTGLVKICGEDLQKQNEKKDDENKQDEIISKIAIDRKKEPVVKMSHDTLDLGCVLSLLDGIGNYAGVIYVGLTNYIEKIPEPLKRSLRLTPVYFTYLRKTDAVSLMENFFDVKLDKDLINLVQNRKITPARLRVLCEQQISKVKTNGIADFVNLIIKESEFESREHYCNIDNTEKVLKAEASKNPSKGGNNKGNSKNDYSEDEESEDE
jgi:hypothetical protein